MNQMKIITTVLFAGAMMIVAVPAMAQDGYHGNQSQQLEFNLFQNFHTPQGPSLTTAALYNAPRPVPYWVGSSLYTYQPLYPHQHLYQHSKNYYNYYGSSNQFYSDNQRFGKGGDALTRTSVVWKGSGLAFGDFPLSSYPAQKALYFLEAKKYGLSGPSASGGLFGRLLGR